jgi:magnesium-transporting ATPase (P-type)
MVDAWLQDAADVAAELGTDPVRGLPRAEAARRLAEHGPNVLEAEPPVPMWRRFVAQFADPLVVLLLVAIAISLTTWAIEGAEGVPFEAIVIAAILLLNAVLGVVQEARAEQAVAALQQMAAATSLVVRDGVEERIASAEVVPGDLLLLAEGDAVSADARLLEAAALTVQEAALTGESEATFKEPARLSGPATVGDRTNMVFSGTAVARGRGRAVVTATGMGTEMGHIAALLGATPQEPTPLQREIAQVGRILGRAVVVVAVVVMAAILATSDIEEASDVVDVLLVGVSLAVAAVPEGLPAILSVVLALGVQRMARKNAIVKDLSSVETLGSASVICTDKTGTLTRNEMTIQRVVTASGDVEVTGVGYQPDGDLVAGGSALPDGPLRQEVLAVLGGGGLANDASLRRDGEGWTVQGDPTEVAFLVAERKAGLDDLREARYHRVGEVPFSSERKLMSTIQAELDGDGNEHLAVVVKGAPDLLLARCTGERVGEERQPLDDRRRASILRSVDTLADDALRTLGVAYRDLDRLPDGQPDETLEQDLVFAGIVGIIDPPRPEAAVAIAEARGAGIRVVMITGDHPRTAARIAAALGIVEDGTEAVTGATLDGLDADATREVVRRSSVFARVSPENKLRIVDALQADGLIVAMTGDGVNDAPALKSADIGVAMGITGTDVSKEAAKMVLADDNFATIVAAVAEGRAIFANIRTFLRYLLSSNVGEVLTMLLGVLLAGALGLDAGGGGVVVPLLATQILWINLLTDAAPALAMGVDPPPDDVMDRPPRRVGDAVIDREMRWGVLFVGLVMAAVTLLALDLGLPGGLVHGGTDIETARTMSFTTLVLAQLFNCFNARSARVSAFHRPFTNPWLWGAVTLSAVLQVLVVHVPFLNDAFDTTGLDLGQWLQCLTLASVVLWTVELRKLVLRAADRG